MDERHVAESGQALRATVLYPGDADRLGCERELVARGVPLPLMHRVAWQTIQPATPGWFVAVRASDGACRYGAAVGVARSRALPGHLLLRVERLDPATDPDACAVVLRTLERLARRRWPRVLRAYVELYSRDAAARATAGEHLYELGFRQAARTRKYRYTAVVDLEGNEDAVFARLHRSARRNVRALTRGADEVRTIVDPRLGERVEALMRESFARTGRTHPTANWPAIIDLSRREPDLSRIVGLFRAGVDGADGLLAFEWACMHGDHAESLASGSARPPESRAPLAYALVWDVMRWARAQGARYLDFGGVTVGTHGQSDPRRGISDFKQSFGATTVEVGAEWTLEPSRLAAALSAAARRLAAFARRASGR